MGPHQDRQTWQEHGRSFGAVAAGYAQLRPGYPADAVTFLLGEHPLDVLDLGAGTGLLTDALLAAGHRVVAVDPSAPMLDELRARHPEVRVAVGGAEDVPVDDASVDAVVAGQAAHWFDPAPAAAEIARVLRPGGRVGFVWNSRDERVPWVADLGRLLAAEARDHEADEGVVASFALSRELAARVETHESSVVQHLTSEQVVGGIGTRSYVATMDEPTRADFLGRVRTLLAEHPDTRGATTLDLPYVTRSYRLTPR
ncbi:methyltransferase domain-containing protein [Modestobacter sp. I12A-02628]|uniref:Methyltransferase domain-containing protein n=1 Tax=Goekera deserti TaxID=2497753 RepID=A0A7K3WJJ0_9ACTN|nr:methyltransferase domain-containing protein [Goekera deserti]NDI48801.1 methyltransferase domain-containing protein [Goekera deserti]NEL56482.1 methyltransferase domain-containing protein [Goekera deserti]